MKNVTILLAVVAILAMAASAQAKTWSNTGTGAWIDGSNWGGTAPGTTDWADIINGGTATISSGEAALCYGARPGGSGGGVINMTGGTFHATGESIIDYNGASGTTNELNQSGGDLTIGSSSYEGRLRIGYGYGAGGLYSISGGTMTIDVTSSVGEVLVGRYGPGTFKVTGGTSSIDFNGSTYTNYDADAKLHAVVNASGLSTIDDVGAATFAGILTVGDDSAAAGTYTVMNYTSKSGSFATVNLPSGDWSYNAGATSLTVTKVPEPATMCLLGIGGIGVLIRRRRK